jgi:hypothetical protein
MLSEELVAEIRFLYSTGRYSMRDLARQYKVTASAIFQAVHYITYTDAPEIEASHKMRIIKREMERAFENISIVTRGLNPANKIQKE